MLNRRTGLLAVALLLIFAGGLQAEKLTILHTNDMHSHFDGYGPFMEYTPMQQDGDKVAGGLARLATAIKNERKRAENSLLIDAGDFSMGTLFHTVYREEALELKLIDAAGYDVITFGNHEYDLQPEGLARMLRVAQRNDTLPTIVASNVRFDDVDGRDDKLEAIFNEGLVQEYVVKSVGGIRVGIFGLLGYSADQDSPFAKPLSFEDHQVVAAEMVRKLREEEKVDLVIAACHVGVNDDDYTKGEEIELAKKVKGIDVIIGAHSHTEIPEPVRVGKTLIVQTGYYTGNLGVMDLEVKDGKVELLDYRLQRIDDSIPGDAEMHAAVEEARSLISQNFLAEKGLKYDQVVAETDYDLTEAAGPSNLGDLIADAIMWGVNMVEKEPCVMTFEANGVIRTNLLAGRTGQLTVADIFRVVPLGFDELDGEIGYPIVSFYVTGREIKNCMEVLTTAAPMKGSDYFLHFAGVRARYNTKRLPFDRVVELEIGNDVDGYYPLDISKRNDQLFKVAANIYNVTYFAELGNQTFGLFKFEPKDKDGNKIYDLANHIVDADPQTPGIQGLKEWEVLLAYFAGFEDSNGNGIANMPETYRDPQMRVVADKSYRPSKLFKNATWPTWTTTGTGALLLLLLAL